MKQVFMTLSVVGFVMMTLKFYLEPHYLGKTFYTLGKQFEYFGEKKIETSVKANDNETDLGSSSLREQLTKSPEKLTTISECGYDVS